MTTDSMRAIQEAVLSELTDLSQGAQAISVNEYRLRIEKAQAIMREQGLDAVYLNAGTNMSYFTGTVWRASERLVGLLIPAVGDIMYVAPFFEIPTLNEYMVVEAEVLGWHEHQDAAQCVIEGLVQLALPKGCIGIDESTPFFITHALTSKTEYQWESAKVVTAGCRMIKSPQEIALIQQAMDMTLAVQKATAKILKAGITTTEVADFIDRAHRKVGAVNGSYFVIVLFGEASAYPHGVKNPQVLQAGDMVLVDAGCLLHGYISDITRSYVFGEPTARQRELWDLEKSAQQAVFDAATLGARCGDLDLAARAVLAQGGFGPDYQAPGLVHRAGHGIGLDIHEWPYLNWADDTLLEAGMCFSNEPMLSVPGECGVRLEDHIYMTSEGPRWFTQPSASIDQPF